MKIYAKYRSRPSHPDEWRNLAPYLDLTSNSFRPTPKMVLSSIQEDESIQEPPSLDRSQWLSLLSELPLFPPDSHPPRTLFPLLSPLLQQKLGLLSLGRGRGWPGTLTWLSPDLSYKVNERLRNSWRPEGLEEHFRGYRRFDQETVPLNPIGSN